MTEDTNVDAYYGEDTSQEEFDLSFLDDEETEKN